MNRFPHHHARTILRALALAMLLPFIVGTTPVEVYYQFVVKGRVIRQGGGSPANHTVVLLGKGAGDPNYRILTSYRTDTQEPNLPVALTDGTGAFLVSVVPNWGMVDSLRLGVTIPGDTTLRLGEPFAAGSHDRTSEDLRQMRQPESTGCSCATEPGSVTYTAGYIYHYDNRTVTIP